MTAKTNQILKMAGILLIGLLLGWLIFGGNDSQSNSHEENAEQNKETIWTCSMHPQIKAKEPGKCPICGMDLIPLDTNSNASNPLALQMTEDAMKLANIQTMVIGNQSGNKELRLNGKVQIDERKLYSQSTHIPGRIEQLLINFTGDKVSKGQTLAYVYSPDLLTAQEELLQANSIKNSQPELFDAAKQKLLNWRIGETTINKIISTGKLIQQFPITADVSGIVTAKNVDLGDYVDRGTSIYEIADLSSLWVLFDIYESDMTWIKVGDKVTYTIQSLPGETFEGKISFIDPFINPQTRVATARIELKNVDYKLKPEMFASGVIKNSALSNNTKDIVIPKTAIMWTGERSVVYIKNNSGTNVEFMLREVTLGPSLGEAYVITSGLSFGEEIVVNGTFTIDAASQLIGKPSMMNPEGSKVQSGHNHGEQKMESTNNTTDNSVDFNLQTDDNTKAAIQPILLAYLKMKDALVNDDFDTSKSNGIQLLSSTKIVKEKLFKGKSQEVWIGLQNDIKSELEHIEHYTKIDEVRNAFVNLSNTMISMATTFKPNETLFVLHCPMANNNKGADWLSNSKEIRNPYYGPAMLACGEVKDIIKN